MKTFSSPRLVSPSPRAVWSALSAIAVAILVVSTLAIRAQVGGTPATVVTDKSDYIPGSTAYITGAGFQPGESVRLQVLHVHIPGEPDVGDLGEDHDPWVVSADPAGGFTSTWHVCEDDCVGATLELTAVGLSSGIVAKTTFTDAIRPSLDGWFNVFNSWGGTANGSNSQWKENETIPVRFVLEGLSGGTTYTAILQYDFVNPTGGHLFDSLRTYDTTITPAPNLTTGVSGLGPTPTIGTSPIPIDTSLPASLQVAGNFTLYNISAFGVTPGSPANPYTLVPGANGVNEKTLSVTFTVAGTGTKSVIIGYGGHLGSPLAWGTGGGASSFNGGSGKMYASLATLNSLLPTGTRENFSLNPGAIPPPPGTTTTISAPTITYGANGLVTVTVTSPSGIPTGSITLNVDSGAQILQQTLNAAGSTTFTLTTPNAGSHPLSATYTPSGYFTSSSATGTLLVLPAPLTVTAENKSKTYDGLVFSPFTVTYSGFVNSETPAVLGGTLSYSGAATTAVNAGGPYTITPGGLTSTNYTITYQNGSLTINQAALTVTADNQSKTYDGLVYSPFTVNYSGFVNGETSAVLGGTLTFGGTAAAAVNVGSYTIAPSGLTSTNYAITYVNGTLNITQAALTVTADNKSKTYDGLVFSPFTVNYSGFVNGDTSAVLGGTLAFGGTAATAVNAGSYTISPSGLTAANYSLVYVNGTLTITQAALTVTAQGKSKTYDGLVYSPFTVGYSGFVNGETSAVLGGTLTFGGTAATAVNVGSYTIAPSGLTSSNYAIAYVNGTLTITQAALTVTAQDKSKTYDGLVFSPFTVAYSGFVNGETSAVLGGTLTFGGTAATAVNVGSYTIAPSGLTSSNYAIAYVNGTLTITQAVLTVTAQDKSKTYDGLVYSPFTVAYSGFVNGETSAVLGGTLVFGGTAATAVNVGSYSIAPSGLTSSNYAIGYVNGTLTITQAALTVTADNQSKTYDGLVFSPFTVNYSGFVNGETSAVLGGTLTFGGTAATAVNVGSYTIAPSGLTSSNYAIGYVNGTLNITKAALTVTADNKSKTYDGLVFSPFTVNYSGFVNGETSAVLGGTLTFGGTAATAVNVGSYTIAPSGLTSSNYAIGYVNGTLNITKAALTVTADNKSKTYDGLVFSPFTVSYSGFVNGETSAVLGGSLLYSGAATTAVNVGGPYAITPSGLTSPNYAITFQSGALTINAASLIVTAANKSKTYDGLVYSPFTVTYSGFVNGETAAVLGGTLTFGGAAATAVNAGGPYAIIPSGLTSSNYLISYQAGELTITKAPSVTTVTIASSFTQDCNPHGGTAVVTGAGGLNEPVAIVYEGTSGTVYGPTSDAPSAPGFYTATATYAGGPNHFGSTDTESFKIVGVAGAVEGQPLYTGSLFFWTTGPSSSTASLALSATVKNVLACVGNISGATVTFWASMDGTNFAKIPNAVDRPVGLVVPTDTSVGTASAIAQWNMKSNGDVETFFLRITVGGTYVLAAGNYDYVVTVAKPGLVNSMIGGAVVSNTNPLPNSSGYLGNAPVIGDANYYTALSANVKYNKSGANPQGKVTVQIHTYNKPDGTVDTVVHHYLVTSTAISEMTLKGPGQASFSSKCTVKELLPNGEMATIDSGNMLQITLIDGSPDQVGITVQKSASQGGGLWYSSGWAPLPPTNVPTTIPKTIQPNGNIVAF